MVCSDLPKPMEGLEYIPLRPLDFRHLDPAVQLVKLTYRPVHTLQNCHFALQLVNITYRIMHTLLKSHDVCLLNIKMGASWLPPEAHIVNGYLKMVGSIQCSPG